VARTYDGTGFLASMPVLVGQRGPLAGAEGLLDVLAGDLVAAGYAVGVDGEQDAPAVPGAGSDFGGRGAGGQPQRRRGMAEVVGAAGRLGACPVLRHGCGAGLVPDPAVNETRRRPIRGHLRLSPPYGTERHVSQCVCRSGRGGRL
jgi:hypothetical protein